ncbi:hypothetical protein GEMRC1_011158 [Eukaryota sp. GEM-RC1]
MKGSLFVLGSKEHWTITKVIIRFMFSPTLSDIKLNRAIDALWNYIRCNEAPDFAKIRRLCTAIHKLSNTDQIMFNAFVEYVRHVNCRHSKRKRQGLDRIRLEMFL